MVTVGDPCPAYREMASRWELPDALLGGTAAMRAGGTRWLPREDGETSGQYQARLSRSVLYEAFGEAVARIVARPFSRPVTVSSAADLPDWVGLVEQDADRSGRTLSDVARESFADAVVHGLSHLLVDMPRVDGELTLERVRSLGVRPIIRHVAAEDVIWWYAVWDGSVGQRRLVEARIRERFDRVGEDGEIVTVDAIRRWTETGWQLWVDETGNDTWTLADEGEHAFGRVPLFTWYTRRTGFLTARPPLESLAWLNLRHWQSASDQANILRFMRTGTLAATGVSRKDLEDMGGVVVGANQLLWSPNPEARFYVVEHSGAAVESGERDLRHLEALMESVGLMPLMELSRDSTATAQRIQTGERLTTAQSWIRAEEMALEEALRFAGQLMGDPLPDDVSVDIFDDFGALVAGAEEVRVLLDAHRAGLVSRETLLRELRRRGILADTVDVGEEAERAQEELMRALG